MTRPPWQHRRPGRHGFPRATAKRILARDPECQGRLPGCTLRSTHADHITPWYLAVERGWSQDQIDDEANGQGMCESCHRQKTLAEAADGRQRAAAKRSRKRPAERHPGLL